VTCTRDAQGVGRGYCARSVINVISPKRSLRPLDAENLLCKTRLASVLHAASSSFWHGWTRAPRSHRRYRRVVPDRLFAPAIRAGKRACTGNRFAAQPKPEQQQPDAAAEP